MRRTAAIITVALSAGLFLAGCTTSGDTKTDAKPSASKAGPTQPAYTADDCRALLEGDCKDSNPRNRAGDPECDHLTRDEYTAAVKDVLSGHVDDIMDNAAKETVWDEAWKQMSSEQRASTCDLMRTESADAVGQAIADEAAKPSGDETKMAQYFLDEKC
ncbi:hypothetical protein ACWCP6_32375 [Streptomyces sp. NPDC002004]